MKRPKIRHFGWVMAVSGLLFGASAAYAGSSVYWSVGIAAPGAGAIVSSAPLRPVYSAPVYAAPVYAAPPVAYAPPPAVVYAPAPIVVQRPQPVYVPVERHWQHRPGRGGMGYYPMVPIGSRFQDNPYHWPGARR